MTSSFSTPTWSSYSDMEEEKVRANQATLRKEFDQTGGERPFVGDLGQTVGDLGKIVANAGIGLVTDYVDLGLGLVDVATETGKWLGAEIAEPGSGQFNGDAIFNDSDNPLTAWRRDTFRTETQAGQIASNIVRGAVSLLSLPKVGIKGLAMAPKLLSKASALGPIATGAAKVGQKLDKLDDTLKAAKHLEKGAKAVSGLENAFDKGSSAKKAVDIVGNSDWLKLTFGETAKLSPDLGNWWKTVGANARVLTAPVGKKAKIRTIGEALAWDAFVAFNITGEGNWEDDETFADAMRDMGLPSVPFLQTNLEDSMWSRKLKQMSEGLFLGAAVEGLVELNRVYRFSRNFKAASPDEQKRILDAFNASSEEIGSGIAGLLPAGQRGGDLVPYRLQGLGAEVETQRIANNYQRDLTATQLRQWDPQLSPWTGQGTPADMASPVQNRLAQMEGLASPLSDDPMYQQWLASKAPTEQFMPPTTGQNPALEQFSNQGPMPEPNQLLEYERWLKENAQLPTGEINPEVQEALMRLEAIGPRGGLVGPRPAEPTVSPETLRGAFAADVREAFMRSQNIDEEVGGLAEQIVQILPRSRVDAVEYLTKSPPRANEMGVIPAADSVWTNFLANRALDEGWATIDPDTMGLRYNRSVAFDIDRTEAATKQSKALDELAELNRYEEWLQSREADNAVSMQPEVQDNLAAKEARDAYDQWEGEQAAARQAADPARADLERQVTTAEIEESQIVNAEEMRLSEAERVALSGGVDDQTVVREYMGTTLDSVPRPVVEKAEVGRGWTVYDENGEPIATTTTRKAAEKIADAEQRRAQERLLAAARQAETDATDQSLNVSFGDPLYDSDVVGKVTLTDRQIELVQRYSPSIQRQMRADWEKRTGGQAWININELKGGSKKTFELTQGEMYDLVDGIKALLQTGEIKGTQASVLRRTAERFQVSMTELEPQARAMRVAKKTAADAQRFLNHGDLC